MKYAKIENSQVKVYDQLPYIFENIVNFRNANIEIINSKGVFEIVTPTIFQYQRLLTLLESDLINNKFIQRVEDFSQEEIDTKDLQDAEAALNLDLTSQFFDNRKQVGVELLDKFNKYIYRKHTIEGVPINQITIALEFFFDALLPLNYGVFELSIKRLNALSTTNTFLNNLKQLVINKIEAEL